MSEKEMVMNRNTSDHLLLAAPVSGMPLIDSD
jgi:hypothetical protein